MHGKGVEEIDRQVPRTKETNVLCANRKSGRNETKRASSSSLRGGRDGQECVLQCVSEAAAMFTLLPAAAVAPRALTCGVNKNPTRKRKGGGKKVCT